MTLRAAFFSPLALLSLCAVMLLLAACSGGNSTVYPDERYRRTGKNAYDVDSYSGLFGDDGLVLLGGDDEDRGHTSGIGVNAFLWRASLDALSFMPLSSADPFGGVIITDWYSPEESPYERFKVNVFILGSDLRADGVRSTVFRQRLNQFGQWVDADTGPTTNRELEDAILTRARQLRISALQ